MRKLFLTVHVVCSVGWLGAVAAFLGLGIVGLTSDSLATVKATYVAMEPLGLYVIVPLCAASLLSGLVQSFVSHWGLVRHYWVIFKLFINLFATFVLWLYLGTLASLADSAASPDVSLDTLRSGSPVLHSAAALILLVVATILAVYKPKGMTRRGYERARV